MRVGDLVVVMTEVMGSPILFGVITNQGQTTGYSASFEVMTSDGKVNYYFESQLRIKK